MDAEIKKEIGLEIGHVLFIDIVGYSKLLIEEQKERLGQLTKIVLGTAQVRDSKPTSNSLGCRPAMAWRWSFITAPKSRRSVRLRSPRRSGSIRKFAVRMGIHSGPVSEVADVSGRTNMAGAGINMAQRVMDCGDAGHILLSHHVAEDLEQYGRLATASARHRRRAR